MSDLATLKCPLCGNEQQEAIPTDQCLPFYKCQSCGKTISAKEEDCCVFCSYGDKKCAVSKQRTKAKEL